ncbi:MAG TPA: Rrf2 family transcriptional regulator [Thermoanaerobaculia bacterium]
MLKISRLTDYGLLASVYLARRAGETIAAREIAEFYHLSLPAVTKVLKTLNTGGVISSHRGVDGGYSFDGDMESITLGQLIEIFEGPWDLTECETLDHDGNATCAIRVACPSRRFMFGINRAVKGAFEQVTLADLVRGGMPIPVIDKTQLAAREAAS